MEKLLPYFSFNGRANRLRYWLTSLAFYGAMLVGLLLSHAVPVVGVALIAVVFIGGVWAGLAVAVRRLHDRNKSAWWLLPMYLPITLLSALGGVTGSEDGVVFSALSLPFSIWILVELGILKGTDGPNRFGPDPLNPSPAEVFS